MCQGKDVRKMDERDMEKFGTLDSIEKMIAILGDRWWPRGGETGREIRLPAFCYIYIPMETTERALKCWR